MILRGNDNIWFVVFWFILNIKNIYLLFYTQTRILLKQKHIKYNMINDDFIQELCSSLDRRLMCAPVLSCFRSKISTEWKFKDTSVTRWVMWTNLFCVFAIDIGARRIGMLNWCERCYQIDFCVTKSTALLLYGIW